MDVTYEWSDAQTRNLHHCVIRVFHELRNELLGMLFLLLPTNKVKIHEET